MLLDAVYEEKLEGAEGRDAELRYVTEHFRDLQGLQGAPALIGGSLALMFVRDRGRHISLVLLGGLCLLLLTFGWAAWLRRWYRARYGAITKPKAASEEVAGAGLLTWAFFVLSAALCIAPKRVSTANGLLFLEAQLFLLPICFAAAPSNQCVLLRRLLYRVAAIATTALTTAAVFSSLTEKVAWLTFCASLLCLGIYDHWLLSFLMRRRVRTEPIDE